MYVILGKSGYIAEALIRELKSRSLPYLAWSRSDVDYTNRLHLERSLDNLRAPLYIINCAGYIGKPNVDACESAKADCIEGNILLPMMLSQLCSAYYDWKYVHISSGCIYNGYERDFHEYDPPNFDFENGSFYSGSKALAEKVVAQNTENYYIFRLRIPFDEYTSPRNYLTKLLSYDTLLDAKNSLSHRGDFAKYSIDLIEQRAPEGIYNITNKGSITTREVVELINEYSPTYREFSFFDSLESFFSGVIAPRSNCVLNTSNIEQYIKIRTVKAALKCSLSKYKYPSL